MGQMTKERNIIIMSNVIDVCNAFKGMANQYIFKISLCNEEHKRKANCMYTDSTKFLYPDETNGEVLILTLENEEYYKKFTFLAVKPQIKEMVSITNTFLKTSFIPDNI